ncbi:hypothetical protein HZS_3938 [Henneguya salminicola]|nr:hypothetical protein HZS_3938 [Henneguya salminicola]
MIFNRVLVCLLLFINFLSNDFYRFELWYYLDNLHMIDSQFIMPLKVVIMNETKMFALHV